MKKAAFVSVILVLMSAGGVEAVTNVTGCGTLNTPGETYVLQNDISESGTCFTIGADNITLDGAGYSITGSGGGYGVYLYGKSGVTIKNLTVKNFDDGIYLDDSSNNTITNNTASNNWDGISIWYSGNNTLKDNTMSANTYNFYVTGSPSDYIQDIDISNTVDGKPIYYLVGVSDLVIDSSNNTGYVGIVNGVNVTVKDLALTRNGQGVLFANTSNSSVLNVDVSNNFYGIYLDDSSSNTIANNTALNNYGGISIGSTSNYNTITGNTISNNDEGINLDDSSNNTITNNTVSNNWDGISIWYSGNNTLTDNTMSANTYNFYVTGSPSDYIQDIDISNTVDGKPIYYLVGVSDLVIDSSNNTGYVGIVNGVNVTVKDLALTRNGQGVLFANSSNSSVLNVDVSNNFYGIYLDSSSSNTIVNNIASNNYGGISIGSTSNYNTITGNTISNNDEGINLDDSSNNTLTNNTVSNNWDGISIWSLWSSSSNLIYNNLFNNTNNFYFGGTTTNTWNTTKTLGTNIVSGFYLGGNFWAYPNGTGFSEQCNANADGFCDSSYTLAFGNVDYLPLTLNFTPPTTTTTTTVPTTTTTTTVPTTTTTTTTTAPTTTTTTTTTVPTTTTTTTTTSTTTTTTLRRSSGGGGGGGAATSFETWIKDVLAGQTFDLDINDEDISYINGLSLTAKQDIYSSKLSITDLDKKPWYSMEEPDAAVFRYFKVNYDKDNYVKSAKFKVSVNKSWLKDNDINPYKFSLYRYTTTWEELDTKILKEDDENIHFEVTTPGFSYFSLGGANGSGYRSIKEEVEISPTPVEEETEMVELPKIETPSPAPPVETPSLEPEPEPVKAPETPEKEKGICGPTVVVLLAMLVLIFARHRRTLS